MERVRNKTFDESELCFRRDVRCLGFSVSLIWFSCSWPFASPGEANHRFQEPFKISFFIIYLVWTMISNPKITFFSLTWEILFYSLPILELEKSNKRFNDGIAVPLSDAEAMRRIYAKVQRPKSIRAGAEKFVNQVIGTRDYLAVHWRFDDSSLGSKIQSICGSMNKDDHVSSRTQNLSYSFQLSFADRQKSVPKFFTEINWKQINNYAFFYLHALPKISKIFKN